MTFAAFLLLAITHIGHWPLQAMTGIEAGWWFYTLQGASTSAAWWWARSARNTATWRILCTLGAIYEALVAVCGVAYMVKPVLPVMWNGLADQQTGLPLWWIDLAVFLLVALWLKDRRISKEG